MTAIAFDGKNIAHDGLTCCGNEVSNTQHQKVITHIGSYQAVAISGMIQK